MSALLSAQASSDQVQLTSANKAQAEQITAQAYEQAQAQEQAAQDTIAQAQQTLTRLANDTSDQALATKAAAQAQLSSAQTALAKAQDTQHVLEQTNADKTNAENTTAQTQAPQQGAVDGQGQQGDLKAAQQKRTHGLQNTRVVLPDRCQSETCMSL
jgi:hypothetical protein